MVVTEELIQRAKMRGACGRGLPPVGATLDELDQEQLIWSEDVQLLTADERAALGSTPLFAMSRDGYGSGSGYGCSRSSGYGDGRSYGDGYGDGSGSGYGDGRSYGDGYGDGYGSGSGYGYGSGYGCSRSYGDGSIKSDGV